MILQVGDVLPVDLTLAPPFACTRCPGQMRKRDGEDVYRCALCGYALPYERVYGVRGDARLPVFGPGSGQTECEGNHVSAPAPTLGEIEERRTVLRRLREARYNVVCKERLARGGLR